MTYEEVRKQIDTLINKTSWKDWNKEDPRIDELIRLYLLQGALQGGDSTHFQTAYAVAALHKRISVTMTGRLSWLWRVTPIPASEAMRLWTKYPDIFWACIAKNGINPDVSSWTEKDLSGFCFLLNWQQIRSTKTKATFLTWILDGLTKSINFPKKFTFNAVRQEYMITPNVSFTQLKSCKLLEDYPEDKLFEELNLHKRNNPTSISTVYGVDASDLKRLSIPCCVTRKYEFIKGIKPYRSKRNICYYVCDNEFIYLMYYVEGANVLCNRWGIHIKPLESDEIKRLVKERNLDITPDETINFSCTEEQWQNSEGKIFTSYYYKLTVE